MGAEPQEARSLPRNRKCGNCRFYEPAPLWRKGWCRNPKLYPPHANHLVDATTIDCEGGFRSRIYWEPLPEPVKPEPVVAPAQATEPLARLNRNQTAPTVPTQPAIPFRERVRPPEVAPYNIAPGQPPAQGLPANALDHEEPDFLDNEIVFTEPVRPARQTRPAPPPVHSPARQVPVAPPLFAPEDDRPAGDWRSGLRQKLPFTRNLPLEKVRVSPQNRLPLLIGLILLVAAIFLVLPNLTRKSETDTGSNPAALSTVTARPGQTALAGTSGAGLNTPAPTAVPTRPPNRMGLVKGVGEGGLNMRDNSSVKGNVLAKIKEGALVTILEGPLDGDGRGWYKIEFEGKTGWAAKEFIELQK